MSSKNGPRPGSSLWRVSSWPSCKRRQAARLLPTKLDRVKLADLVFHFRGGKAIGRIDGSWATACKKAGVPGRHFHDLRRTAIRNLVRAGVPEGVAMRISGHRDRSTFDRYNITSESDLRLAQRLQLYLDGLPSLHKSGGKRP